jgi:feruloyl-CoA synthase
MTATTAAPFRPLPFLERSIDARLEADGTVYVSSQVPLGDAAPHLPAIFARTSQSRADQPWLVQRRGADLKWQTLTYGDGKRQVDAVTQALLGLDQPGRAVMVLSGNSLEHGVLQLAAMQARMPHVPVTPAYSLLATDLSKLQSMVDLIDPAVVFVQSGRRFERALRGLKLRRNVRLLCVEDPLSDPGTLLWGDLACTPVTEQVARCVAAIELSTVAKYLFTSGSTGTPKAVTITQRMLTTAVMMHGQMVNYPVGTAPNVILSWMPWSHVAAGLAQFCNSIAEGGTLYLDEGKPVAGAFEETLRNLRDVAVTHFSSVPVGFTMLAEALETDPELARHFFANLQRLGYSGAKLPDSVLARIQALAVANTGYRIPFVSAYGSTETAASVTMLHWTGDAAGGIGLPHPGVELKLLPLDDDRFELRVRSPAVTPGYFKEPTKTKEAFDEEGFFRMGDAVRFVDRHQPDEGLVFAGRVAEEFKLQTGIFVRVGSLRVEALESARGLLSDAVVTGADQPFVGLLAWPNLAACRKKSGDAALTAAQLVESEWFREEIRAAFQEHNHRHPASSMRIRRVLLQSEPPSLSAGEITDKGYVNQNAVLQRRAEAAERLYFSTPAADVIIVS